MTEKAQDNKLSKRKKRLLFILFLLFAMMFFLDMLIRPLFPNNPWMQICFEVSHYYHVLLRSIGLLMINLAKLVYQPYSLISLYFENKWIIVHFFFVFVFVDSKLMKFSERVSSGVAQPFWGL